jgi:hypothetical protein
MNTFHGKLVFDDVCVFIVGTLKWQTMRRFVTWRRNMVLSAPSAIPVIQWRNMVLSAPSVIPVIQWRNMVLSAPSVVPVIWWSLWRQGMPKNEETEVKTLKWTRIWEEKIKFPCSIIFIFFILFLFVCLFVFWLTASFFILYFYFDPRPN